MPHQSSSSSTHMAGASVPQDDVLLTVSEVAKLLRVDTSTIRRWIAIGTLQAVALPGSSTRQSYRIRRQTLDTILHS